MSARHARCIRTLVAAVLAVPALASAQIPLSTGESAVAGRDAAWDVSLNGGGFFDAFLVTSTPGVWQPNTADYGWISAEADASVGMASTYRFRTMFDLSGFDVGTVSIGFRCALDNFGGNYTLNGGASTPGGCGVFTFGGQQSLTAANGLVAGSNTLEFTVGGDGVTDGLLVNFNSFAGTQSTVPEPATVALMATGLVVIGGIARRRRSA